MRKSCCATTRRPRCYKPFPQKPSPGRPPSVTSPTSLRPPAPLAVPPRTLSLPHTFACCSCCSYCISEHQAHTAHARVIESRDENFKTSGEAERSPVEYCRLCHADSESRPLRLELPVKRDAPSLSQLQPLTQKSRGCFCRIACLFETLANRRGLINGHADRPTLGGGMWLDLRLACEMMGCSWRVASFLLVIHRGFDLCPCEAIRRTKSRLSRGPVTASMSLLPDKREHLRNTHRIVSETSLSQAPVMSLNKRSHDHNSLSGDGRLHHLMRIPTLQQETHSRSWVKHTVSQPSTRDRPACRGSIVS